MDVKPAQADNELGKEHVLDFVVNAINDELPLNLNKDTKITSSELYEIVDQSHLRDDGRLAARQYRLWTSH